MLCSMPHALCKKKDDREAILMSFEQEKTLGLVGRTQHVQIFVFVEFL